MKLLRISLVFISLASSIYSQKYEEKFIFPLQSQHVHSSSIVELPNGDLLTCWFQGSGERWANDVVVNGSRLKKGETKWSAPFLMADTPNHPDCNPMLFLNQDGKLFLFWVVVRANKWEASILKYKTSTDYFSNGAPKWNWQDIILLTPGNEFSETIEKQFKANPFQELSWAEYAPLYEDMVIEASKDPKKRTIGWMTRTHPTILKNNDIILPLYSDGFNLGINAISKDKGETWTSSLPIVGRGVNQPSIIEKTDGTLIAYMRDDGDAPGRIMLSESKDNGYSWSFSKKSEIPNPGASIEIIKLNSRNWLLIYNDVDDGRYSLCAALSDDEGKSWKWKKHLEKSEKEKGSFSYPSVIQAKNGKIQLTYSYSISNNEKSIKHISFTEDWIKE